MPAQTVTAYKNTLCLDSIEGNEFSDTQKKVWTAHENGHGNLVKVRVRRGKQILFKLFFFFFLYVHNMLHLFPPAIPATLRNADYKANLTHLDVDLLLNYNRLCKRRLIFHYSTLSAAEILWKNNRDTWNIKRLTW